MQYDDLICFLHDIQDNDGIFFIEAEAKVNRITNFINEYNLSYTPAISYDSNGIIILHEDANKWGLELRLYVNYCPPDTIRSLFSQNNNYRDDYSYRMNDNNIIMHLFSDGYRIGLN